MKKASLSLNSSSPRKAYLAALDAADSVVKWQSFLDEWAWLLSPRVMAAGHAFTPEEFNEWRRGLHKERAKEFAGEEWAAKYSDFLLPLRLMLCDGIADKFLVPWIVAWRRLEDTGQMPQ